MAHQGFAPTSGATLASGFARRGDDDDEPTEANFLGYIPNFASITVFITLYLLVAVVMTGWHIRYRAKYMIAMIIGAYAYGAGIGMRYAMQTEMQNNGIYIGQFLLVVLSPCAIIATIYTMLARLGHNLGADQHLLISSRHLTRVFILSDVMTFLIQATGGTMNFDWAIYIYQAGLGLQLLSFLIFTGIYLRFLLHVARDTELWTRDAARGKLSDWRYLAAALVISCITIIIRSVFRVLEGSINKAENSLGKSQVAFYALDTVPIWISIAGYVVFWPGRILRPRETMGEGVLNSDKRETVVV